MKILVSAYSCDPNRGSEPGYGYNWSSSLEENGHFVVCLTQKSNRINIESYENLNKGIIFYFVNTPRYFDKIYKYGLAGNYIHYLLWQFLAYLAAKKLHKKYCFELVQHVSWGSLQLGSFMFLLRIPFVYGPVGGGQMALPLLKKYFGDAWQVEIKRLRISKIITKYNPAFLGTIRNAQVIVAANNDTVSLIKSVNPRTKIFKCFDGALSDSFQIKNKVNRDFTGTLKLLWIGRVMPRKGLLLILDAMSYLKKSTHVTLTIVGDGPQMLEVKRKAHELGLNDSITFVGQVPHYEVVSYYLSHHVFFFTSLRDSGPSQLLEAISMGLPIVSIDIHGQSEIIEHEVTGLKCEIGDVMTLPKRLADLVLKLDGDRRLLKKLSENCYSSAKNYSWKSKVEMFNKEIYTTIA
jgi:glycosyltransferase involved in cell wall biosynthesis